MCLVREGRVPGSPQGDGQKEPRRSFHPRGIGAQRPVRSGAMPRAVGSLAFLAQHDGSRWRASRTFMSTQNLPLAR